MTRDDDDQPATSSFGFTQVAREEKPRLVQDLFNRVADDYDVMNDLMSLGVHRLWKDSFVSHLRPFKSMNLLDLAGGTGDIAARVLDRTDNQADVVVCDLSEGMVRAGKKRFGARMGWVVGDALRLPFSDRHFDGVTMAFGLRNVADIDACLQEIHRVLKPGGRFCCLEFSQVHWPVLDRIYEEYSFKLIPRIGAMVAKDRAAYQYLVESIRRFPPQEELVMKMRNAGFGAAKYANLSGGIAAMHSGLRVA